MYNKVLMKKYFLITLYALIFSSTVSVADTSKIKSNFFSSIESFLNDNFENTNVSIKSTEGLKPQIGILTLKPLVDNDDGLTFFQGSFFTHDGDRETLNLGLGKRMFNADDSIMFGLNAFYDHELDYDHQRASVGIEAISSVGSFRLNQYYGLSGWTTGLDNVQEKALNGQDIEVGAPLPYLPWTNFSYRSFQWDGASGAADLKGDEISLEAKLPIGLNIEVGKRSNDGVTEDNEFLKLTWTCCNKNQEEISISDTAYNLTSVVDQKFAKVKRQNLIVKQKEMSLTVIGF